MKRVYIDDFIDSFYNYIDLEQKYCNEHDCDKCKLTDGNGCGRIFNNDNPNGMLKEDVIRIVLKGRKTV